MVDCSAVPLVRRTDWYGGLDPIVASLTPCYPGLANIKLVPTNYAVIDAKLLDLLQAHEQKSVSRLGLLPAT